MTTTPICNPHICRVLLGAVGNWRYYGGTVGYCGYCRVLEVLWGTGGVWEHLGVIEGSGGYSGVL